ncbi:MAG: helix-hairpin-helix domain-containing protein, partial [Draconibacterium sp.]|nr:helix-hairpin-helix domain-containing protein [Draconibacterium sp.]
FDPNNADFAELKKFGFNNYQANKLINYRTKGGVFYRDDDLLKIYGVDTALYKTLKSHIHIEPLIELPAKAKNVEVYNIELNEVDSIGLVNLPGIGKVYAARIIKYRNLLGGYYSKKQLLEVYNFPEETYRNIEKYIVIDTALISKVRINFAEYKDLLRHPYLNKMQVESILNYKEKNGAFESIAAIRMVSGIDSVTYSKIKYYFTCR